jgi:hypothetical protein
MKKIVFVSVLFISLFPGPKLFAQVEKRGSVFDLVNLERHQFKFNLINPGFSYELGIFKNQSISTDLGLFGLATYQEGYSFGASLDTRYRFYHNFNRRIRMDKNVSGNSGDYIGAARTLFFSWVRLATNIEGPDDYNLGCYGLVYGMQRTYPKGFNFNAELGAGYYLGDGVPSGYGPLVTFTFGWVATQRKLRKPTFE